jgi:hypothetical protein
LNGNDMLHVTKAEYRKGYRVWLCFDDGSSGEVDLSASLTGSMFAPLTDKRVFSRFRLDEELGTIVWENGADLAPEYLRDLLVPVPQVRSVKPSAACGQGNRRGRLTHRPAKAKKELAL